MPQTTEFTKCGIVSNQNISLWETTRDPAVSYQKLNENIEVDVAIVGGGITGLSAANHLLKLGKTVAVLEAIKIGCSTTSYSTGNLYVATQPHYHNIVKKFNLATAKEIAKSRIYAIDQIENTIRESHISCNFSRRSWYAYANESQTIKALEEEQSIYNKIGIDIYSTTDVPFYANCKKAIHIKNQARLNPTMYVQGLAKTISNKCYIFEDTRITDIQEDKDICVLIAENGRRITCKKIILATHTPIGINFVQQFTACYRSYVVAATLTRNSICPDAQIVNWDIPHQTLSTHPLYNSEPELLMIAGNHHKTGQSNDAQSNYDQHVEYLQHNFPMQEVLYKWSAQHYQSADNIPYIGLASRKSKHVYMATGFYADGLVYGTLAGILLGDIICKKSTNWTKIYDSNRFKPISSAPFLYPLNNLILAY